MKRPIVEWVCLVGQRNRTDMCSGVSFRCGSRQKEKESHSETGKGDVAERFASMSTMSMSSVEIYRRHELRCKLHLNQNKGFSPVIASLISVNKIKTFSFRPQTSQHNPHPALVLATQPTVRVLHSPRPANLSLAASSSASNLARARMRLSLLSAARR